MDPTMLTDTLATTHEAQKDAPARTCGGLIQTLQFRKNASHFLLVKLLQHDTTGVFDMSQNCPAKPTRVNFACLISLAGLGARPPRSISPSLLARVART
jgi:hypothetical protein